MWDGDGEDQDKVVKANIASKSIFSVHPYSQAKVNHTEYGLNTAEAVMLAQQLVNREKTKTQLINDGFNRYSLNSKEGLPSWFLDDEAKNYKLNIPVTKEAMAALRAKQRALDARPIKKVAEAKARKKFKAAQRLEKAMKKAEGVNATADLSEKEKAQQIDKLMRKGVSAVKKAKKEVKLVVAKGSHKGIKGRPKGVKGRYTMVDSRMKKEVCVGDLLYFEQSTQLMTYTGQGQKTQRKGQQKTLRMTVYFDLFGRCLLLIFFIKNIETKIKSGYYMVSIIRLSARPIHEEQSTNYIFEGSSSIQSR